MPKSVIPTPAEPKKLTFKMEAPADWDESMADLKGNDGHLYKTRPGENGLAMVPYQAVESAEDIGWTHTK